MKGVLVMYNMSVDLGVALIFFNRDKTLSRVFQSVREARPKKLFLIQDGARSSTDYDGIQACRKIVENIDWDCDVLQNYSEENLGCGKRMSSGISWVFDHVEKAIILEDDCVPSNSFYQFCDELLMKYCDDTRILMISGMNHWVSSDYTEGDYLFAMNGTIWGWATWKRSWHLFDYSASAINNKNVEKMLLSGIEPFRVAKADIKEWKNTYDKVTNKENISYWAHQWRLAKFINHNLCIIPKYNMISNIGDEAATHPGKANIKCIYHNMETFGLQFPLKHPAYIYQNYDYDKRFYNNFYPTCIRRIIDKFKRTFCIE